MATKVLQWRPAVLAERRGEAGAYIAEAAPIRSVEGRGGRHSPLLPPSPPLESSASPELPSDDELTMSDRRERPQGGRGQCHSMPRKSAPPPPMTHPRCGSRQAPFGILNHCTRVRAAPCRPGLRRPCPAPTGLLPSRELVRSETFALLIPKWDCKFEI